jgi:hypothetical protein
VNDMSNRQYSYDRFGNPIMDSSRRGREEGH